MALLGSLGALDLDTAGISCSFRWKQVFVDHQLDFRRQPRKLDRLTIFGGEAISLDFQSVFEGPRAGEWRHRGNGGNTGKEGEGLDACEDTLVLAAGLRKAKSRMQAAMRGVGSS